MNVRLPLVGRRAAYLLFPILLTPLVRMDGVFFDSVVPRAVWFRAAVALGAACLSAVLLLHSSRPQGRDPLLLALAVYVAVQLLAALAGSSPQTSVWGTFDRMWGVATWTYLLLYYALLRAFLDEGGWRRFMELLVAVSGLVSFIGILQSLGVMLASISLGDRITSTVGSPAHLAVYLLISLFVGCWLWSGASRGGRGWLGVVLVLDLVAFALTNTISAWLGLGAALAWLLGFHLVRSGGRRGYVAVGGVAVVAAGVAALLVLAPNSTLVRSIALLERISTIGLDDPTVQGRFFTWTAGLRGIPDHPFLGAGPENFGLVFSAHFPPETYGVLVSTYADRAHNLWIDLLATSGIFGLGAYLTVWVIFFLQLRKAVGEERFSSGEGAILVAAGISYLVYMLFWFEDLSSTISLLTLFAFVSFKAAGSRLVEIGAPDRRPKRVLLAMLVVVVSAAVAQQRGFRILGAARATAQAGGNVSIEARIAAHERAVTRGMPEGAKTVQPYVRFIEGLTAELPAIQRDPYRLEVVHGATQSAMAAMQGVIERDPQNDLWALENSGLLQFAAYLYGDQRYLEASIDELRRAISLAPSRLRHYHALADAFLLTERPDSAMAALERARAIRRGWAETDLYVAKTLLALGDTAAAADTFAVYLGRLPQTHPPRDFAAPIADWLSARGRYAESAAAYASYLDARYGVPWRASTASLTAEDLAIAARLPVILLHAGEQEEAIASAEALLLRLPGAGESIRQFIQDARGDRLEAWPAQSSLAARRGGASGPRE